MWHWPPLSFNSAAQTVQEICPHGTKKVSENLSVQIVRMGICGILIVNKKKVILVSFLTRIISYLVTYQPKKVFLKRQFLQQARPLLVPYHQVLIQGVDIPESQERLLHQAVDAQISLECLAIPMTHCSLPKLHRFKYLVTPKG